MKLRALILLTAFAAFAPVALAWPGRPSAPPPKTGIAGAPPPAWIETKSRSAWLLYGSYCWRTSCIDMIPPETRPGLPVVVVPRGTLVRIHLGFRATSASVSVDKKTIRPQVDPTRRIISWPAGRGGILLVFVRAAGDASYVARLRVR
jgi:hypothetical protein